MAIDKADVRYGFYVGIGLLLAVLVWHLLSRLAASLRSRGNG
jgi:hypothetical protein